MTYVYWYKDEIGDLWKEPMRISRDTRHKNIKDYIENYIVKDHNNQGYTLLWAEINEEG